MKFRFFSLIFAPITIGLIAGADQAKAVLNYNIYESSGSIVIETGGSLSALPTSTWVARCGANGAFLAPGVLLCTGPNAFVPQYNVAGPGFISGSGTIYPASSVSGITTILYGSDNFFIDTSYVLGTPILSSAIFNGKTLADFGLTSSSGLLGTWTLSGTTETINVRVVPGPLPLLGAGAAFGFCRRLRRRVNAYRSQAQN